MEKCIESSLQRNVYRIFLLIAGFSFIVLVTAAILMIADHSWADGIILLIGTVVPGSFLFWCIIVMREYRADADGITVRYLKLIKKHYSWDQFDRIVVCDIGHDRYQTGCQVVIRLFCGKEFRGPNSKEKRFDRYGLEHWRDELYNVLRFRSIIYLEFTPQRLEHIRTVSNLPVINSLTKLGRACYDMIIYNHLHPLDQGKKHHR